MCCRKCRLATPATMWRTENTNHSMSSTLVACIGVFLAAANDVARWLVDVIWLIANTAKNFSFVQTKKCCFSQTAANQRQDFFQITNSEIKIVANFLSDWSIWRDKPDYFRRSDVSSCRYQFSNDHWSQATLSSGSTWIGDCSKCCLSAAANP